MKRYTVKVHYRYQTHVDKVDATATFDLYAKSEEQARGMAKRAVEATAGNSHKTEIVAVSEDK